MERDAVSVAPHIYKVVLENERVRILEVQRNPGDKTEMHTHPAQVAIAITDCNFRFTKPDGEVLEGMMPGGQILYLDPQEHSTELLPGAGNRALLIELK